MGIFINIGFGNIVNSSKVVSIISPDSAPIKRLVQSAKDDGRAIDATQGRRTRAVLVMDDGHIVLSALLPETIANRYHTKDISSDMFRRNSDEENELTNEVGQYE